MSYITVPPQNIDESGNLISLDAAALHQTKIITGLLNGVDLRVVAVSKASPVVTPQESNLVLPIPVESWTAREAVLDADTRRISVAVTIEQQLGYQIGVYRGPNPEGNLSQVGTATWQNNKYVWTSSGRAANGTVQHIRIARAYPGAEWEWISADGDTKPVTVSGVPEAPAYTYTPATDGDAMLFFSAPVGNGRNVTGGEYQIGAAGWVPFTGTQTLQLSDIGSGSVPVSVRWVNANGYSGVTTRDVSTGATPRVSVSVALIDRTVTATLSGISGTPAPEAVLADMKVNGLSVIGQAVKVSDTQWTYTAPDSTTDQTVEAIARATNTAGVAQSSASVVVLANIEVPANAAKIVEAPTYDMQRVDGEEGTVLITITKVPGGADAIYLKTTRTNEGERDYLICEPAEAGTFKVVMPEEDRAGRLVATYAYGSNAVTPVGPYPKDKAIAIWVAGKPQVTCRISPTRLCPGDTAIVTIETYGFPVPTLTNFTLSLGGSPVQMDGDGHVRSFVVPSFAPGMNLTASAQLTNQFGTASHSFSKTISNPIPWKAPIDVTTRAELDAALAAATGGEVIRVADGYYSSITLKRATTIPIKLVSQNLHGAAFDAVDWDTQNRKGIWLDGFRLTSYNASKYTGMSDLRLENCEVVGKGIDIVAKDFVVRNCTVDAEGFDQAGTFRGSGYIVADSTFKNARYDHTRFVASQDALVDNIEVIRDIEYQYTSNATHPDLCQLYGLDGRSGPARIAIRRSFFWSKFNTQGLFMTDARDTDGYKDCVITDNVVACPFTNKLTAGRFSSGSLVTRNTAAGILNGGYPYGGLITKNLSSQTGDAASSGIPQPIFPRELQWIDNYEYQPGNASVNPFVSESPTRRTHYIPRADSGIPDEYGATAYLKTLPAGS